MEIIKEIRLHITLTVSALDQFTYLPLRVRGFDFDPCLSFVSSTSFDDLTKSNSLVRLSSKIELKNLASRAMGSGHIAKAKAQTKLKHR